MIESIEFDRTPTDVPATVSDVRGRCRQTFLAAGVAFTTWTHQPVLDYETARTIRERFSLVGTETKSLLLRTKKGLYVMFISLEGERLVRERARNALKENVSLASPSELVEQTGCVPGCAVPLGLPPHVRLLVDPKVEAVERLILSPGPPTETVEISVAEWVLLLKAVPNLVVRY